MNGELATTGAAPTTPVSPNVLLLTSALVLALAALAAVWFVLRSKENWKR